MQDQPREDVPTLAQALLLEVETRLASEAAALRHLNELSLRLWQTSSLHEGLREMLSAVIELLGADKGNVQLLDGARQVLTIVAQQGFDPPFLEFFSEVSAAGDSASGRALRSGHRIVIEDVEADEGYRPLRGVAAEAGFRAVQSTPIIGSNGKPLGMLSAHFAVKHRPSEQELDRLDLYVRQAAYFIERCRTEDMARESEARLRAVLDSSPDPIFLKDREGRMVLANRATHAVVGKPAEAILGRTDEEFLDNPTEGKNILATDRRIMASGQAETVEEAVSTSFGTRYYLCNKAPFHDARGSVIGLIGTARDVTERKQADERIQLLLREVSHRSKNMLTLVQAIARQTLAVGGPQNFLLRFDERLQALAANQDLLVKHGWEGAELEELIRFQLSPFKDLIGSRIQLEGPSLFIPASKAQALGMAIHELATNASKYGALSGSNGHVDVRWHFADAGDGQQTFIVSWREAGGPPVVKPVRNGFGSKVIGPLAQSSFNGKVELDYATSGLTWRLTCPAKEFLQSNRPPT